MQELEGKDKKEERESKHRNRTRRRVGLLVVVVLAVAPIGVLPSAADHGGPHPIVEFLTPDGGAFTDDVAVQVRVKLDGRRTNVVNVHEPSRVVVAEITVPDGAAFPWHTHPGPVIIAANGPGTFTYVNADDCALREYGPGSAFIDPGQGNVHTGFNDSGQDLVLYATFLGVDDGVTIPVPGPDPDDCDPFPTP